jgi:tellurite resistance protein TerC
MRAVFIFAGLALIEQFHLRCIYSALLIFTGIKLAFEKDKEVHPEKNPVIRLFKSFSKFLIRMMTGNFSRSKTGEACNSAFYCPDYNRNY